MVQKRRCYWTSCDLSLWKNSLEFCSNQRSTIVDKNKMKWVINDSINLYYYNAILILPISHQNSTFLKLWHFFFNVINSSIFLISTVKYKALNSKIDITPSDLLINLPNQVRMKYLNIEGAVEIARYHLTKSH